MQISKGYYSPPPKVFCHLTTNNLNKLMTAFTYIQRKRKPKLRYFLNLMDIEVIIPITKDFWLGKKYR